MALFSAKIKDLEGKVSALTIERDALLASNAELTQANTDCAARFDLDQTTIAQLTQERDAAVQRADAAEQGIQGEVTKRIASAGIDPIRRDPKAVDNNGQAKPAGTGRERLAAHINAQFAK